ncbi:lipopolysaccharide biosynthesis protein [Hoeflea sp. Naph1]|uniref:lipopolysaccharide biosynthesis protein n=1 Tax=Hoeflea sp. Naph1 TaxID=3388653 RepID=UPI0039900DB0
MYKRILKIYPHGKTASLYLFFNIFSAIIPIITLPIFTRLLTPNDYGILAIFNISVLLTSNLFRLELNAALKRNYFAQNKDFSVYLSSAFWLSNILFLLLLIFLIPISFYFPEMKGISSFWYYMILLIAYTRFHTVILHHLFQINNRALVYGLWGLLGSLFLYGATYVFIVKLGLDWKARAWAEVLFASISMPVAVFYLYKDYRLGIKFSFEKTREMLNFSTPILMGSMISYALIISDRIIIAKISAPEELGFYSIAIQLASIIGMIYGAVLPVWESWVYKKVDTLSGDDILEIIKIFLILSCMTFLLSLIAVPLLYLVLPFIVDESFDGVGKFVAPAIIATNTIAIFGFTTPILSVINKAKLIAKLNLFMILIAVPLIYFLVYNLGAVGASIGLTVVYSVGIFFIVFFLLRYAKSI